jgi:protoheme IX farnesyltransferase
MALKQLPLRTAINLQPDKVCSRCLSRLSGLSPAPHIRRSSIHTKRKLHGNVTTQKSIVPQTFVHDYFSANDAIDRGWLNNGVMAAWRSMAELQSRRSADSADKTLLSQEKIIEEQPFEKISHGVIRDAPYPIPTAVPEELPHRRRKRLKQERLNGTDEPVAPLDASSQLTAAARNLPSKAFLRRNFATYLSLAKPRLSFLILLTTTSAYSLFPIPDILSSTTALAPSSLSTSTLTLAYLTTGTFLSCACANTLNMLFEPKYDALMTRTRNRPLVRKLLTPRAATVFAVLCGTSGLALLYLGTNPTVAGLSALNIFLYAGVYTPMKRISALNTWAGAVVGGIPPLMGWAAAAGQVATSEHHSWKDLLFTEEAVGGWLLAALLFAWQFPHFNSLSHGIRDDYRNAGHKMLCWTNPARNGRVALRYSVALFPICVGLWWAGVVDSSFLAISTVCNVWVTREAIGFWRKGGAGGSARGLFWASVWHLPLVLVGALVCKKGIWEGVWEDGVAAAAEREELEGKLAQDLKDEDGLVDVGLAVRSIRGPQDS